MNSTLKFERTGDWSCQDILFSMVRLDDAERFAIGSSDFKIYEIDFSAEKPERQEFVGEGHTSYVTSMVVANEMVVSGSYDGHLVWWNLSDRQQVRRQQAHDRWIRRVAATPDGTRIVSVADDMQCKVWDAVSGDLISSFTDHPELTPHHYPSMLYALAISADGQLIATGDRVGHVAIWDAERFEKVGEVEAPGMYTWDPKARRHSIGGIRSLAFSPDATKLAVGGIGKIGNIDHLGGPSRLEIFNWADQSEPVLIEDDQKKGLIEQIHWQPDSNAIVAAGGDHKGFINLYDLASAKLSAQSETNGHIHALASDASYALFHTAGHNRMNRFKLSLNE